MLTKIVIRNFKRFEEVEIELGDPVVFIGPNNSGKTSALQALALWDIGLRRWIAKRGKKGTPERRPGITIDYRDLLAIPVPEVNLLWHGLRLRDSHRVEGKMRTSNVRIDIIVHGITRSQAWECGLEFDYEKPESFYCRPLRLANGGRMPVPDAAGLAKIAFLPPMSGLAATETRIDDGAVNVRIGEGRTAEVLRNLCYRIQEEQPEKWDKIKATIHELFGAELNDARYVTERGEIAMSYQERSVTLDLSSSGRGLQQTLLLLSYMYSNPGSTFLLDEPDAHLEVLRQRETYNLLTGLASEIDSQIIAASHSEVLLDEAAGKDMVIAFVGKPHRIDGRNSQVIKALNDISSGHYFLAEQTGWVLYLEGPTDLAILQAFARRIRNSEAVEVLRRPFIKTVGNQPPAAARHYHGLREAFPQLEGIALFDRLDSEMPRGGYMNFMQWNRREIENYLCTEETLMAYARASTPSGVPGPLFPAADAEYRAKAMHAAIGKVTEAMETMSGGSPWSADTKVSDDFLTPLFRAYFKSLDIPNLMAKKSFYELAEFVPDDEIDPEIGEKLDAIVRTAKAAKPRTDED